MGCESVSATEQSLSVGGEAQCKRGVKASLQRSLCDGAEYPPFSPPHAQPRRDQVRGAMRGIVGARVALCGALCEHCVWREWGVCGALCVARVARREPVVRLCVTQLRREERPKRLPQSLAVAGSCGMPEATAKCGRGWVLWPGPKGPREFAPLDNRSPRMGVGGTWVPVGVPAKYTAQLLMYRLSSASGYRPCIRL